MTRSKVQPPLATAAIAAYLGSSDRFEGAVADFAETCADRNEEDFGLMQLAILNGHVEAQRGL